MSKLQDKTVLYHVEEEIFNFQQVSFFQIEWSFLRSDFLQVNYTYSTIMIILKLLYLFVLSS